MTWIKLNLKSPNKGKYLFYLHLEFVGFAKKKTTNTFLLLFSFEFSSFVVFFFFKFRMSHLYTVHCVIVLDSDGKRIFAKVFLFLF